MEYQVFGAHFNLLMSKSGSASGNSSKAEIDAVPVWATPAFYVGPLKEFDDFTDLNALTQSCINSASALLAARKYHYNGSDVTYGSKKGFDKSSGEHRYSNVGGSGSFGYSGSYSSFVIREKGTGDMAWNSVGYDFRIASASGEVDSLEAKYMDPRERGKYKIVAATAPPKSTL